VGSTAVIGLQWGDEAKGKIVDLLTETHDMVVRYQGGNNAGHTVVCNGQTYKLSLLPVGVLRPGKTCVITGGCVINPAALLKEIDGVRERNLPIGDNLLISNRAHVIFPYHMREEAVLEQSRKAEAIGTTMRGIGTCYRDKYGRSHAIRMGDLLRGDSLRGRLREIVAHKNTVLSALGDTQTPLVADAIADEYLGHAARLQPHITDTTAYLHRALAAGKSLLFEGAQGSLLDIDHGTFPYVTSSNSSGAGLHNGSGIPERRIDRIMGIVKAYTTRVGGGPFPTELDNDVGQRIRDVGREYGTVTGRPRRCGWFDAVAAGYSARLTGVDCVAVMLLDVLSQFEQLSICTAYEIRGERTTEFPAHVDDLAAAKPVLETVAGWHADISKARTPAELPTEARKYIDRIGELLSAPVDIASVGPDREQTIHCR
jgi:adenylosuccinate synthase